MLISFFRLGLSPIIGLKNAPTLCFSALFREYPEACQQLPPNWTPKAPEAQTKAAQARFVDLSPLQRIVFHTYCSLSQGQEKPPNSGVISSQVRVQYPDENPLTSRQISCALAQVRKALNILTGRGNRIAATRNIWQQHHNPEATLPPNWKQEPTPAETRTAASRFQTDLSGLQQYIFRAYCVLLQQEAVPGYATISSQLQGQYPDKIPLTEKQIGDALSNARKHLGLQTEAGGKAAVTHEAWQKHHNPEAVLPLNWNPGATPAETQAATAVFRTGLSGLQQIVFTAYCALLQGQGKPPASYTEISAHIQAQYPSNPSSTPTQIRNALAIAREGLGIQTEQGHKGKATRETWQKYHNPQAALPLNWKQDATLVETQVATAVFQTSLTGLQQIVFTAYCTQSSRLAAIMSSIQAQYPSETSLTQKQIGDALKYARKHLGLQTEKGKKIAETRLRNRLASPQTPKSPTSP